VKHSLQYTFKPSTFLLVNAVNVWIHRQICVKESSPFMRNSHENSLKFDHEWAKFIFYEMDSLNWSLNSDSKHNVTAEYSFSSFLRDSPCLWNCPVQQWSGFQTRRPEGWGQLGSRGEHTEKGPPDNSAHQQTHSNCSDILHWGKKSKQANHCHGIMCYFTLITHLLQLDVLKKI